MVDIDPIDSRILRELQRDADRSVEEIADLAGLSRNAIWRRIKALEAAGILKGRVALVDPQKVGLGLSVYISVKTDRHDAEWAEAFRRAVLATPEILRAYRTSGDQDYLIHARVADVPAYDRLYRRLIEKIALKDVSARFVMEELKDTTELPIL